MYPDSLSKNKTFEKIALKAQQLFEGHDYIIRTSPKTFRTETLFVDWIDMVFLVRINYLRQKFASEGPVTLFVDGYSTHVTARVIAFCGANRIILVWLIPHSSHISQPLDLCVFGIFKILY
jgi:4-hydroxybenzoate polyprenyltransferase